jgi:hypothetical protein
MRYLFIAVDAVNPAFLAVDEHRHVGQRLTERTVAGLAVLASVQEHR